MSSGAKTMVINSLERAVSTDINRLQSFGEATLAEIERAAMNTYSGTDDADAGGLYAPQVAMGSPVVAEIYSGLVVLPQSASFNLLVSAGVARFLAPDAAPDDSPYKLAEDAGVSTIGALAIAANASGSIRIDVIECQWTVNTTAETDNRDIFNPSNSSFTPVSVSKATVGQLAYRVRQGTPGSGYPGAVLGWLPLCIASVPNAAASNDTCTFWDVRPLVEGRIFPPFNLTKNYPTINNADFSIQLAAGAASMGGNVDCAAADDTTNPPTPALYRLGGIFTGQNLNAAAQFQDGTLTSSGPVYVYLLEPFGLPRWAQYTATGTRLPSSPRGILVASKVSPTGSTNAGYAAGPNAAVSLPTGLGLVGSTRKGVCIAVSQTGGASTLTQPVLSSNKTQYSPGWPTSGALAPVLSGGNQIATFTVVAGTHYPVNAKALLAFLRFAVTAAGTPSLEVDVAITNVSGNSIPIGHIIVTQPAAGQFGVEFRIPVQLGVSQFAIVCTISSNAFTSGAFALDAWEL